MSGLSVNIGGIMISCNTGVVKYKRKRIGRVMGDNGKRARWERRISREKTEDGIYV